ncbi:unnamed protein product [Chondrus crispus]|uniref:Uncharacterized protein n=1 Tax=Chondrus crispus TaxID=2769 RepID=R7QLZ9_CHOCR|nr:unnamed protein product [Chondrus crispus]CDF38486.1 unnamed protein product [Chondrus crispus]|eukprot:XP_005718379.1 unnamed protein product [Chondrus crispus]
MQCCTVPPTQYCKVPRDCLMLTVSTVVGRYCSVEFGKKKEMRRY